MREDIVPKEDSMVTRITIELSLIKDARRFGKIDGGKDLNMDDMREQIENENKDN